MDIDLAHFSDPSERSAKEKAICPRMVILQPFSKWSGRKTSKQPVSPQGSG